VLGSTALTGCSSGPAGGSAVEVDAPSLPASAVATCRALVADLPHRLARQAARPVTPRDAPAAAWGDPAITLGCGADVPREFNRFSSCVQANGVGWFVPEAQQQDQSADVTWTAVGYRPVVSVHVPAGYRPEGAAAVIAELAPAVKDHLRLVRPCR
jgi:hypothetical protein